MNEKILIVEDEFIVANDLRIMLTRAGYEVTGVAASVVQAMELIQQRKPRLVLLDIYLKGALTGIDLARELRRMNIAFVYLSANSNQKILEEAKATEPYGFLVKPFREKDVLVTLDIARYRHKNQQETSFFQEGQLQKLLAGIGSQDIPWTEKLQRMAACLQRFLPFDYVTATIHQADGQFVNGCSYLRIGFDQYQILGPKELSVVTRLPMSQIQEFFRQCSEDQAVLYDQDQFLQTHGQVAVTGILAKTYGFRSNLVMPVWLANGSIFRLSFYSKQEKGYDRQHLDFLSLFVSYLAIIGDSVPADPTLISDPEPVVSSVAQAAFQAIVGSSHTLLRALDLVAQVAPLNTSVLIFGESGTGKEKIASAIHKLSSRSKMPMVKVNCAALPASLVESELFGHEKGAFTGALERRIGKFEQADGGTIFLDEIGEMPLEMQVKLLRVLQEKEIERIGGRSPLKLDVRIIAATNRNLEKEVAEGRFRLDLYFRLNVFPVYMPALRERMEDVPQLAGYFAERFSEAFQKPCQKISSEMLQDLQRYHWPGNIRELENVMEQAVILHRGGPLLLPRPLANSMMQPAGGQVPEVANSMEDVRRIQENTEREYILSVLMKTHGRIRGAGGASELLQMKPTTLESRMAKLGIRKEEL